jgi:hypothetical protein
VDIRRGAVPNRRVAKLTGAALAAGALSGTRTLGLVSAVAALGMAVLMAPAAQAETQLGPIRPSDIRDWCSRYSTGAKMPWPADTRNAYTWRCVNSKGMLTSGVNMNQLCTNLWGSPAYARALDPRKPSSWICWR